MEELAAKEIKLSYCEHVGHCFIYIWWLLKEPLGLSQSELKPSLLGGLL